MKYSIDADQELLQEVKEATGLVTDSETIEFALETLVRMKKQEPEISSGDETQNSQTTL